MIKIAIVENSESDISLLTDYLNRYIKDSSNEIVYDVYTDGAMLVERRDKSYNIIIMDIEMPIMDGMKAAEEIRKTDDEVIIMFITNMAQYAIKGYEVGALDYLLKPVSYFALSQRLDKAILRSRKTAAQYINVRVNRGMQKINVADIKYIESRKHLLVYHTSDEEFITNGTIKNTEAALQNMNFAKANNGCLINLRHVDATREGCVIVGKEQIPLSRSRKASFEEALANYISDTM